MSLLKWSELLFAWWSRSSSAIKGRNPFSEWNHGSRLYERRDSMHTSKTKLVSAASLPIVSPMHGKRPSNLDREKQRERERGNWKERPKNRVRCFVFLCGYRRRLLFLFRWAHLPMNTARSRENCSKGTSLSLVDKTYRDVPSLFYRFRFLTCDTNVSGRSSNSWYERL